jgi:beta-glucosidase
VRTINNMSNKKKRSNTDIYSRINTLIGRMTLKEKISQLATPSPAIPRLKIPGMFWGGECLHGLVHTGVSTQFPMPVNIASTFNPGLVRKIADAIASEARAKHHDPAWQGPRGPLVGLNFWTPNINIFRDPRWGRGQETYGEDPYLTGTMASAFVRGLQGGDPKRLKVGACAKHLAVHSGPERLRTRFDAKVSKKDLWETYLPAFKMLVDAGVESVMASYNRVNGEPCPASPTLLKSILRDAWGFKGHVVSDGGALSAIYKNHKTWKSIEETALKSFKAGCDLCNDGGNVYEHLSSSIRKGLLTEEEIDTSLRRLLSTRFKLGQFDPPSKNPYRKIHRSVIRSAPHLHLAYQAALESAVLLKNNGILPLGPETKIVGVCGPTAADAEVLLGNFYRGTTPDMRTVLEGIVAAAPEGTAVKYLPGGYSAHKNLYPSGWHIGVLQNSEVAIAVVGLTPLMEGEQGECIGTKLGGDRIDIELPEHQKEFIRNLKWAKKPVILIVTGGSPLALGEFHDMADAVLWAGYPGEQGGLAIGDILFGNASPSGRLCVTFPRKDTDIPDFADYSMNGRTYRFMKKEPLYPFGFGLSYSSFHYGPGRTSKSSIRSGESLVVETRVRNTGKMTADEVVQLYVKDESGSVRAPICSLKGFTRIRLRPGASKTVRFRVTPEMMELVGKDGRGRLEPGWFTVYIGGSSPGPVATALGASKPAKIRFKLTGKQG